MVFCDMPYFVDILRHSGALVHCLQFISLHFLTFLFHTFTFIGFHPEKEKDVFCRPFCQLSRHHCCHSQTEIFCYLALNMYNIKMCIKQIFSCCINVSVSWFNHFLKSSTIYIHKSNVYKEKIDI